AEVTFSGKSIPTGGYTMWTIPGKKDWSLIVSKNTSAGSAYDGAQDIARAQIDGGMLPDGEKEFKVFFGHLGPKVCELNVVYGKVRAWVEFKEKEEELICLQPTVSIVGFSVSERWEYIRRIGDAEPVLLVGT